MAVKINQQWVDQLSFIEFVLNSQINASRNQTAFKLVYGYNVPTVVDCLDGLHHIEEAQQLAITISRLVNKAKAKLFEVQETQAKYYNSKHKTIEFDIGDQVLLSTKYLALKGTHKLQQHFIGPMYIVFQVVL